MSNWINTAEGKDEGKRKRLVWFNTEQTHTICVLQISWIPRIIRSENKSTSTENRKTISVTNTHLKTSYEYDYKLQTLVLGAVLRFIFANFLAQFSNTLFVNSSRNSAVWIWRDSFKSADIFLPIFDLNISSQSVF